LTPLYEVEAIGPFAEFLSDGNAKDGRTGACVHKRFRLNGFARTFHAHIYDWIKIIKEFFVRENNHSDLQQEMFELIPAGNRQDHGYFPRIFFFSVFHGIYTCKKFSLADNDNLTGIF